MYAKGHIDKSDTFWNNVLWIDKSKIVIWAQPKALCMVEQEHSIPEEPAAYCKI